MTEFLKDFNFVKSRITKSKTINQVVECKILLDMFTDKYVVQVSHMNPIFIVHRNELMSLYDEKFRSFSSCI
jgi:hypothetical protein